MGKGKQKKPPLQQGSLAVESYQALKKPLEHLGKKIDIPGSFWQYKGRVSEEDHNAVYKCTVLDFSLMHKFSPDGAYTQAFHLQEMGVDAAPGRSRSLTSRARSSGLSTLCRFCASIMPRFPRRIPSMSKLQMAVEVLLLTAAEAAVAAIVTVRLWMWL